MKKTLCLFSLMMGFVLTVSSVFAATVYKYDETYYMKGTSDQAYAILEGNEDQVTGRISNVNTDCSYRGRSYVAWANYSVSRYTASVDVEFFLSNVKQKTVHLSI